jgi:hypothetical protein
VRASSDSAGEIEHYFETALEQLDNQMQKRPNSLFLANKAIYIYIYIYIYSYSPLSRTRRHKQTHPIRTLSLPVHSGRLLPPSLSVAGSEPAHRAAGSESLLPSTRIQ